MYQTACPHSTNYLQHHFAKGHHDTLYGSITLLFKQQVLTLFLPFSTILAMPHYPLFTDRHSPQYVMLTSLLHFMSNTFFSTFLPLFPYPLQFHLISQSYIQPNLMLVTIPDPYDKILLISPPPPPLFFQPFRTYH